jgi:fluoride exporter
VRGQPLRPSVIAVVALGGAAGALLRWTLSVAWPDPVDGFPWTIFMINVAGAGVLALLPAFEVVRRRELLPPLLGTGVLGGFTTLSTYSDQARALVAQGRPVLAATYVVGTLAACLLVVAGADRFSTAAARADFDREEGDE